MWVDVNMDVSITVSSQYGLAWLSQLSVADSYCGGLVPDCTSC